MSGWTDILQAVKQRHPFLKQLKVCGSEHFSSPLPEALQASFDIAENQRCEDSNYKHLAMIFPLLLDCPEWIAVGCSLAAIKQDFLPNIESLTSFFSGQKLLLDGKYVVEYVKEEELYGTQFLWMKMSAKSKAGQKPENTIRTFPVSDRLRFQPTDTRRPLTPIENIDSQPSDHPLDRLLDIGSFGNRSIFTNEVVLVSRLNKVRQFSASTHIVNPVSPEQSVSLRDLFQWGGITVEGELEQWGHQQIDAEPVIGVAPDLITLREYLFNRQSSDVLIILDSRLPFANDLQALDEILDEGFPIFAVMENRHLDDLKHLENREFKTWAWSEHDLQQFELAESIDVSNQQLPFRHFHRTVQNYNVRQIEETICDHSGLDSAAEKLQIFSNQCHSDNLEHRSIERRFYYCLLNLSRLLRPFGVEDDVSRDKILKDLEQIQLDVKDKATWLGQDAVDTAHEFVEKIKTLIENSNSISDKIIELEKVLQNKTQKNRSAIVLADASEVSITERYWQDIVPRSKQKGIHFVTPSDLDFEQDYDHLIVCGWLGTERMRKLFDSCIAPSITVVMYPFEQAWFRLVVSRWCREKEKLKKAELTKHQKAKILQTQPENLSVSQKPKGEEPPVAPPETDFDIADFELRLHTYRRGHYPRPSAPGETMIEARFVYFSHDMHAYLRSNHKVPVVTDFIAGHADESAEIPFRDVSQLKVGDYVIFREGSDSDLLRDLADRGLARAGKGEHREIASLWKRALMQFVFEHSDGFEGALKELRDEGLKCTKVTILRWLNDEHLIGPRNEQHIEIIARVSGNQELQERLDYVRRAIKEVRGAHLQAASFLAQKLMAQLPSFFQQRFGESHTIEIEDIGQAFVVCVEYIDEEDVEVPRTEVNRLFRDEF